MVWQKMRSKKTRLSTTWVVGVEVVAIELMPGRLYIGPANEGTCGWLASDCERKGVLILKHDDGSGRTDLVHIFSCDNPRKQVLLNVWFDSVKSILDDGVGGALLHYKSKKGAWKLANASFGESDIVDKYSCPKSSKLSTTGRGAVWVLQKQGNGSQWGLQYLNGAKSIIADNDDSKYPAGSLLAGALA